MLMALRAALVLALAAAVASPEAACEQDDAGLLQKTTVTAGSAGEQKPLKDCVNVCLDKCMQGIPRDAIHVNRCVNACFDMCMQGM